MGESQRRGRRAARPSSADAERGRGDLDAGLAREGRDDRPKRVQRFVPQHLVAIGVDLCRGREPGAAGEVVKVVSRGWPEPGVGSRPVFWLAVEFHP